MVSPPSQIVWESVTKSVYSLRYLGRQNTYAVWFVVDKAGYRYCILFHTGTSMKVYGLWGHRFIIMLSMLWGVWQCDSDTT